jgi:nucleotide-binding universal stress UspA family protein
MSKILLPDDGSAASDRAVAIVLEGSGPTSATELHLLNVQPHPVSAAGYATPELIERFNEEQLQIGRQLLAPVAKRAETAKVPTHVHVIMGVPEQVIVEQEEALGCDLIVMGTRGLGAIKSITMGSVASKVVHLSKRPVTLVK